MSDFLGIAWIFARLFIAPSDSFLPKLEKNYFGWEYQFCMYVRRKELWGHIVRITTKLEDTTKQAQWKTHDAYIISWILISVTVLNLRPYKTAKRTWNYLIQAYHQENSARRFQLKFEIIE